MADPKDKAKDKPKGGANPLPTTDPWATLVIIFIVATIVGGIYARVASLLERWKEGRLGWEEWLASIFGDTFMDVMKIISILISVLSVIGIVILVRALTKINKAQNEIYRPKIVSEGGVVESEEQPKNRRWEKVVEHMNSENPNDWKFAILEADIILDELLDFMGYRGETVADKLKLVESGDFDNLDAAWEAHKVRNQIAHEGADFLITEREARRVIALYRKIFDEFLFI
ncbi:MAG: hypothetical protein A2741_01885 [Candidatus Zambryskibacteria bacterium RIFCSPHIGHO2_01_FULL_43_27]|uniref:Uncharacterized protein n=1 Tax=Candidatus Zambryskibacteria bacterium RIFCSPLOWO2_01_FULL_43_17 TaxID=1802760 RepID=A0A1G2U138_9BACT|nr:MAG: hypothetical protein A2741_01885 [Candidatus Zambryskibacteria bacterium RIFCSPHIGHO2_01_FULL_43_27]OHA99801.1 MAG: hypothetical protein A3E93_01050 [Candidatus Zambryskibacteria bacterium RIFCSPHIGHO2_12_FULL_43_12b]OHB03194.1 MAG: hypothetical protein A2920_02370 [Candidatus Zambryskibacteria bacterium RIFCSPLOWO2_01_FULL_43_17]